MANATTKAERFSHGVGSLPDGVMAPWLLNDELVPTVRVVGWVTPYSKIRVNREVYQQRTRVR